MKTVVTVVVEIAILILCFGFLYSISEGFSTFNLKTLSDNAEKIIIDFRG